MNLAQVYPSLVRRCCQQLPALASQFHSTALSWMPQVLVPPLGESVSEGTISSVLKKTGDKVAVDEVVAQLETDKVTIDCKSSEAGVVNQVLVAVGDIVKPGSVLCVVGAPGSATAEHVLPKVAPPSSSSPTVASATSSHRPPSIKFPPRVLPDGRRISALPADEVDSIMQWFIAGPEEQVPEPQPATPPEPAVSAAAQAAPPAARGGKPAVSSLSKSTDTVYMKSMPTRRALTQSEIDMINAGGAF